ncbi:hypothetical protein D9M69_623580 [compost metagenome]
MLRRQAIAHGNTDAVGGGGDVAADGLAGIEVAHDEATPVAPDEGRQQLIGLAWFEDPQRDGAGRAFDLHFADRRHRDLAAQGERAQPPELTRLRQRILFDRAQARRQVDQPQQVPGIPIQSGGAAKARHTLAGEGHVERADRWFEVTGVCVQVGDLRRSV